MKRYQADVMSALLAFILANVTAIPLLAIVASFAGIMFCIAALVAHMRD